MMRKTITKTVQFSYIRVFACLAIVLLHTLFSSSVYFEPAGTDKTGVQLAEDLLMWAVPCFLMVTGALLLDPERQIDPGKLFGKYLRRIVLTLVVFTLVFQILEYCLEGEDTIFRGWIDALLWGKSWAHMWYLYLLTGLYLMLPAYRAFVKCSDERGIWYLTAVLLFFTGLLPVTGVFGHECAFYIPTFIIYPAYLFIGYLIDRRNFPIRISVPLLLVCTAALTAFSLLRESFPDQQASTLLGYSSVFVAGQSAAVFSLMKRLPDVSSRLLKSLDDCSFGIYILHMIGIRLIMKWNGFNPYETGAAAFAGITVICFAGAFIVTFAIRRIPGGNIL